MGCQLSTKTANEPALRTKVTSPSNSLDKQTRSNPANTNYSKKQSQTAKNFSSFKRSI